MSEPLQIVLAPGEAQRIIRRSRFISLLQACASPQAAAAQLAAIRRRHPKATHHVSAYRVRAAGRIVAHCDDDGEPGGTAGRPTLQTLEHQALVDASLVTVRYFGGIKLGAGGLVRAYGACAREAVGAARVAPLVPRGEFWIRVDFELLTVVEHLCAREQVEIRERRFAPQPELRILVELAALERLARMLNEGTAGRAEIRPV
jgi:uncharacterized YigZ family protein